MAENVFMGPNTGTHGWKFCERYAVRGFCGRKLVLAAPGRLKLENGDAPAKIMIAVYAQRGHAVNNVEAGASKPAIPRQRFPVSAAMISSTVLLMRLAIIAVLLAAWP